MQSRDPNKACFAFCHHSPCLYVQFPQREERLTDWGWSLHRGAKGPQGRGLLLVLLLLLLVVLLLLLAALVLLLTDPGTSNTERPIRTEGQVVHRWTRSKHQHYLHGHHSEGAF